MAEDRQASPSLEGVIIAEREGYWELCLRPTQSFPQVMERMGDVQAFCVDKKPSRMLLDLRGFVGPLSVTDRYEMGNFGARIQGLVGRVAVVVLATLIDPQKFAVKVAQNRGLNVDVFPDPDAALRWLLRF